MKNTETNQALGIHYVKTFILVTFCLALCAGCATQVHTIGSDEFQVAVGQRYRLQALTVQIAQRGSTDALIDYGKPVDQLSSYRDFDPYSQSPLRNVPVGTIVKISKIAVHRSGFITVYGKVQLEGRTEVDLSPLVGGKVFDAEKARKYLKRE